MTGKKKTVSVFMDPALQQLLKEVAKKTNRSFSYVVSFFCIEGVNKYVSVSKAEDQKQEVEPEEKQRTESLSY